jgi:hypothetical protein
MSKESFKLRVDDLELRWSQGRPEIVRWVPHQSGNGLDKEYCYTLLWWVADKEGWNIHFCGPRPFSDEVSSGKLWELCKVGDKIFNTLWEFERQHGQ